MQSSGVDGSFEPFFIFIKLMIFPNNLLEKPLSDFLLNKKSQSHACFATNQTPKHESVSLVYFTPDTISVSNPTF